MSKEKGKNNEQATSKSSKRKQSRYDANNSRSHRQSRNSKRRPKETEVDISDADINKADLSGVTKSSENDGSWYSHYPELVQSFGSIPFTYPLGTPLPISQYYQGSMTYHHAPTTVPGLMALDWYPVIGQANGFAADPINQAANKIYVYVRHTLSTYAQYDASDMMMYILAMDSIFTMYSELVRMYGVALNWKVLNRYYAKAALQALGVEPDTVLDNLANFRGQINEIAYMLNQFVVPAGFDYITRHTWMASSLFIDSEAAKSQTYFYRLGGYYELVEVTEGPMYLRFTRRDHSSDANFKLTATQLISALKRCISLVMNSQDCIAMSGDLLKAFGPSGTFVAIPVAENYIVEPIYSKEVLSQIENAIIFTYPFDNSSSSDPWNGNIRQMISINAGPNITQTVRFGVDATKFSENALAVMRQDFILNFHAKDVTPIDVMVATRLSAHVESIGQWPMTGTATQRILNVNALGSEVLANAAIFYYDTNTTDGSIILYNRALPRFGESVSDFAVAMWINFDWAPRLFRHWTSGDHVYTYVWMDIDNYAVLSESDLIGLHSTAMMSLFEVPAIAKLAVNKFDPKKKATE